MIDLSLSFTAPPADNGYSTRSKTLPTQGAGISLMPTESLSSSLENFTLLKMSTEAVGRDGFGCGYANLDDFVRDLGRWGSESLNQMYASVLILARWLNVDVRILLEGR